MGNLRKRPFQLNAQKEVTNIELEKLFKHYDDRMVEVDNRRINQQSPLADGAALADVITALNTLVAELNGSDLTND